MSLRRLALAAAVLVLAGCTVPSPDQPPSPDVVPAADGGALDTVTGRELLPGTEEYAPVWRLAAGPDGQPIALVLPVTGAGGPLTVVRPGAAGWQEVTLTEHDDHRYAASLHAAPDGTVLVAGFAGGRYAVSRIAPDGSVVTVPVATDLPAADGVGIGEGALSPDGATLYVPVVLGGATRLLAIDPLTGAVRAEAPLAEMPANLDGVAVAPDGTVVVALDRHDRADGGQTPTLARFDAALAPLGTVVLADGPADVRHLGVTGDGTVVAVVHVGLIGAGTSHLRVVTLAPGAAVPETVTEFPEHAHSYGFAVDPAGGWAYLAGLENGASPLDQTVTPVDLATGAQGDPVSLCTSLAPDGFTVTPDGGRLLAAVGCDGGRGQTTLVTVA
ncbi:YncE family protein [Blastococcus sp. SYSU D00820]